MTVPRLANPTRTAEVLRELVANARAAGYEAITLTDLEAALDLLEEHGWELPKKKPTIVETFSANGDHP